MANIKRFHPGIYIKDSLESMNMTSKEFAIRTGISERTLSSIINGNGNITFNVAYKLSIYFDNSINYWTNLQNQYDLYKKEKQQKNELRSDLELIKEIKDYLLFYNYVDSSDSEDNIIYKTRKLVGVNALSSLESKDCFDIDEGIDDKNDEVFLQNFWLAFALNESRKSNLNIKKYNKKKLKASINEIKALTITNPNLFCPRLEEIFLECGIHFVLLPFCSKSNICGATKWFNKNEAMLAISNGGGDPTIFWTSLFHEVSHVLMERRRKVLASVISREDVEAEKMANDMLIPKEKWNDFILNNDFTYDSITNFSSKLGILPSLVLFRLHKEKSNLVSYDALYERFKTSYTF